MKYKISSVIFAATLLILGGCKDNFSPTQNISVRSVEIDVDHITMDVDQEQTFHAKVEPENATDQRLVWSIDNATIGEFINPFKGQFKALNPGDATITVRTKDGNLTDTCLLHVNEIATRTLVSISIATNGQDTFNLGEEFKHDLITVTATYSDEQTEQVFNYDISSPDMDTAGNKVVTVSYTEGQVTVSASYTITVLDNPVLTGIRLDTTNVSKSFTVGSTFDYVGLVVYAVYSYGDDVIVTEYDVSEPDMTVAGEKTITITYLNEYTATYKITVNDPQVIDTSFASLINGMGSYPSTSNDRFEITGIISCAYTNAYNYTQYYIQSITEEQYALSIYGCQKALQENSKVTISGYKTSSALSRYNGMPQINGNNTGVTFSVIKDEETEIELNPCIQTSSDWINSNDTASEAYQYAYNHGPIKVRVNTVKATKTSFTFKDNVSGAIFYGGTSSSVISDIETKITNNLENDIDIIGYAGVFASGTNGTKQLIIRKTSDIIVNEDPGGGGDDPSGETLNIDVYAINDFHGAIKEVEGKNLGLAKVGSLFKEVHNNEENALILDQGDDWQGSIYSNYNRGKLVNDVFAYSGVDARTVGNHDFDWGVSTLIENTNRSYDPNQTYTPTPVLAANVYDYDYENKQELNTQCDDIGVSTITKVLENGLKVGVVGVIGQKQFTSILSLNTQDIYFKEHIAVMKNKAVELKEAGCNVVIGSIHCSAADVENNGLSDYFDLVLCGHSHADENYSEEGMHLLQFDSYGSKVGKVSLSYDTGSKTITDTSISEINSNNIGTYLTNGVDQNIVDIIDEYEQDCLTHEDPDQIVAKYTSGAFYASGNAKTRNRGQLGNLMATAIYDRCISEGYDDVDLTIVNQARTYPETGKAWTYADVYEQFPFDNNIYVVSVKGSDVRYIVGSFDYTYYSCFRDGFDFTLDDDAYYKIAVIDYLLYHVNTNKVYNYFKSFTGTVEATLSVNYRLILRDWLISNGYANGTKTLMANDFYNSNPRYDRMQIV